MGLSVHDSTEESQAACATLKDTSSSLLSICCSRSKMLGQTFGGLGRRSTWRRTSSGGTALKIPSGGHSDRFQSTCTCQSRIPGGVDGGVRGAWLHVASGGVHGKHAMYLRLPVMAWT